MKVANLAYVLISLTIIVIILIYGKGLMIPFIFAVLLWFVIRELRQLMNRSSFVKSKIPSWFKNLLISAFIIYIITLISRIITTNINKLAQSYEKYEANIELIIVEINNLLNIDVMEYAKSHSGDFDFGSILGTVFSSITDLLGNTVIILIYALFIFLEESHFQKKLRGLFSTNERFEKAKEIISKIEFSIARYMGLKTLTSLSTGLISYFVLKLIGIDAPAFWAFLIFILNYIPTIGSIVATTFPAIFCLLQFGEIGPGLTVLFFVGLVQLLVGNVIEPRLMGNSLNVSPLVVIISLTFWGVIWGVTGMILSVPVAVTVVIIFSHFDKTKPIAIVLSEKGKI